MEKHDFKKKFGQNFLNNESIINDISNSFDISQNSLIVEVGPGAGALTKYLVNKGTDVIAFEIDTSLKKFLDKIEVNNLKVIYEDFLNIRLNDYIDPSKDIYFVSNVPYYITTPIINKFIDEQIIPEVMVMMVQKEVAERLSAKPGNKEYGAISVLLNYYFDIDYLFTVDRNEFYPIPNVDSAVIKFTKKDKLIEVNDFNKFKKFVFDAFKQKRKNLRNNLKNYDLSKVENVLNKYNFTLSNRAEELSYEIYIDLFNNL